MSYNIDSVDTPVLNAWILKKDLKRLYKKLEGDLPEMNVLEEHLDDEPDEDGRIKLRSFEWCGTWSGNSWKTLIKQVAPKVMGEVEAIFTWEGGDSIGGLLIKDGKVAEVDVKQQLVRPEGW
jgi:hypothetical protein